MCELTQTLIEIVLQIFVFFKCLLLARTDNNSILIVCL